MRLSQIKLAGFKSFVDPTVISLSGQRVGIVGPNGCGKSNVIDALRWVLGESRASALRGESLQDVIFNGSVNRKPVSRASVELIFDNSLGKVGGQWASYAEISIKRVLQRNGDSSYYINNQTVRRKDVTDIFLGTGVGARAYAIIEQGMISRLIEAKPEELRSYLEEAAGVSKYRERRRETELRLADSRVNLSRVSDILNELNKQLEHLTEQAAVAQTYRELEARRATIQHLLWLLNKQEAAARRSRYALQVEKARIELEAEIARLREIEKQLESARSEHFALSDALHAKQGDLYATNAEVARLEQQIAFINEQRNRLLQQIHNSEQQIARQRSQLKELHTLQEHWQQRQQESASRLAACEQRANIVMQELPQAEEAMRLAQEASNAAQRELLLWQQQVQLAETQLTHIQSNVRQLDSRRSRLLLERDNLPSHDQAALEQAQQALQSVQQQAQQQQQLLAELQAQLPQADTTRRAARNAVQEAERQLAQTEARLQALQQLQAQLDNDKDLKAWLAAHGLEGAARLWQSLRTEPGWEDALEAVLRERINALALPQLDLAQDWRETPPAKLAVYAADGATPVASPVPPGKVPLAAKVQTQDERVQRVLVDWLAQVYVATDLKTALSQRGELAAGAWLVTPQGHLVSAHSVLFYAPDSQVHGILARQREIEALQREAAQCRSMLTQGKAALEQAETTWRDLDARIMALRNDGLALQQRQHQLQLQIFKLTQAHERSRERGAQIQQELDELAEHLAEAQRQQEKITARIKEARARAASLQIECDQARQRANVQEAALRDVRERAQHAQREVQEARFFAQTCADKLADLERNIAQQTLALQQQEAALEQSRSELEGMSEEAVQEQLQEALQKRQAEEQLLAEARNRLEVATTNLNQLEQSRLSCTQRLNSLRDKVGELTLQEQEARLQFEQWSEYLQGVNEGELLPLIEDVKAADLQNELARISNEISALGAVNLAAPEALQSAQERKTYLEAQAQDLNEAIGTLEEAIRRIDKESRELLKATYEAVNNHLGEMFPVLFGGGEARLVLNGDEILDSGVQVMAHPPGKKNTSIHLLSGGEKALTAIALVFSLFQLNPAPFCVLDEVDAPLDDTNTERLCKLIQKMAEKTQFVFVSHNKITMEMAEQLIGVTMQERGVSKIVSVNIEEAMRMRRTGTESAEG